MEVILADVLGYCMGVRRAVDSAVSSLKEYKNKKVYSLGPLIHNQSALDTLASMGLCILKESDLDRVEEDSVVIIRAHGVPPKIISALEEKHCIIVNATCPRVVASQRNAYKYAQENYTIILAGDANHGEVTGIQGYAGNKFILVQNNSEAEKVFIEQNTNAILLSQTTFSPVEFQKISQTLLAKCPSLKVMNTICPATKERQDALNNLCPRVDGILVVGGKNSANTKRLLQTAEKHCAKAVLIETSKEIPEEFYKLSIVGITAGASTPDEVIQDVQSKLCQ